MKIWCYASGTTYIVLLILPAEYRLSNSAPALGGGGIVIASMFAPSLGSCYVAPYHIATLGLPHISVLACKLKKLCPSFFVDGVEDRTVSEYSAATT